MVVSKHRVIVFWCVTIIFLIGYLDELKRIPQDAVKTQTYQVAFIVLSGIVSSLIASFVAGKFLLVDVKCGRENINNILSTGFLCFKPDQQSLTDEEWAYYIKNAPKKSEIYLFGTANFEWVKTDACRNSFESVIKRNDGVSLYIYFLNPLSEWAKAREKADNENAGGGNYRTNRKIYKSIS